MAGRLSMCGVISQDAGSGLHFPIYNDPATYQPATTRQIQHVLKNPVLRSLNRSMHVLESCFLAHVPTELGRAASHRTGLRIKEFRYQGRHYFGAMNPRYKSVLYSQMRMAYIPADGNGSGPAFIQSHRTCSFSLTMRVCHTHRSRWRHRIRTPWISLRCAGARASSLVRDHYSEVL